MTHEINYKLKAERNNDISDLVVLKKFYNCSSIYWMFSFSHIVWFLIYLNKMSIGDKNKKKYIICTRHFSVTFLLAPT